MAINRISWHWGGIPGTTTAKNRTFWHWAGFRSKDARSGTGATFRSKTTITNRFRSQNNGNRSYYGTTKEPDREGPRLTRKLTKTSFNGGSVFGDQNLQGFRLHRRGPQVWKRRAGTPRRSLPKPTSCDCWTCGRRTGSTGGALGP